MKTIENNGCKNLIGKLIFCLLLAVLSTAFVYAENASAAVVDSGTCGENLTWALDDAGTLTISGSGEMNDYTYPSHAPWYYNKSEIKNVVIENGVAKIGRYAFDGCSSITEVHYNGNSKEFAKISIGGGNDWLTYNALIYCLDRTIKKYGICGDDLFWILDDTGTLTISGSGEMNNYKYLDSAPWYSYRLEIENVVIENGVTSIGNNAFYSCSLTEVHYNSTLADFFKISIGDNNVFFINAKLYCTDIVVIDYGTCGDNLTWALDDAGTLIISGSGEMGSYSYYSYVPWYSHSLEIENIMIENGAANIGRNAFYGCSNLTSLTIPDSVTSIGDYAFDGCTGLTSITIPGSVMSIGDRTFYSCSSLTEVHYNGSVKEFVKISIGEWNDQLTTNTLIYCADNTIKKYGTCGDNLTWALDDTGTLIISGSGEMNNGSYYSGPWYSYSLEIENAVIENGATNIGDFAFYGCSNLTSITIPASITIIGSSAFDGCSSLTSVTIPGSVTSIGSSAFSGCSGLTSFTIPGSVTSIGSSAFSGCTGLTSVTIPDSVTIIGSSAFSDCSGLTSVTIPNGVTSIDGSAFYGCTGLTSITIPGSVMSIGDRAFYSCSSLTEVHYNGSFKEFVKISIGEENGCLTNNPLIYCTDKTIKKYGICGDNLIFELDDAGTLIISGSGEMGSYSYYSYVPWYSHRLEIENIMIENGAANIGKNVFYGCTGLTSITIPGSVTSIGDSAFSGCTSLTSVTIPGSVTIIGSSAFSDCSGLTSVTIPNGVTSIDGSAFSGCTGLTSVTIPDGVTSIGGSAFRGCTGLTSITIPDGVTSIGGSAFRGCSGLTSITIPASITVIGDYAFDGCYNLTEAHYNSTLANFMKIPVGSGDTSFINAKLYCTDIVAIGYGTCGDNLTWALDDAGTLTISGSGEMDSYSSWYSHRLEIENVVIENGVTSIDNSAFDGCSSLTSVTIPDSVTSIGQSAFYGCSSLTSISIPDSVTNIGGYAFDDCSSLTSMTIPDGVTSIGESAFSGCTGLTSITIPDSVKSIGDWAFYNCYNLTEVYYNSTLADFSKITIGEHNTSFIDAKMYCTDIVAIGYGTCGDNLTWTLNDAGTLTISGNGNIYGYSVSSPQPWEDYGSEIKNLVIENGITGIGTAAFASCSDLTSVTIPDSVTYIGNSAFYNCSGLTSITIPNGVTGIGWGTFQRCDSLTSITIPVSVTRIDNSAFGSCSSLKEVHYGGSEKLWEQITINSGNDELTNAKIYYNEASLPPDADGICGNNLTWTLDDAGTLTISGRGAMNDYTNSSAPWYNRLSEIKNVVIEGGVTSIGYEAFKNCNCLTSVTISDSVMSIGVRAFAYCNQLTSVTIPDSVTSIGIQAFDISVNLKEINVDENNLYYASDDGVLLNKNKTEIIFSPRGKTGSYTIPDGVTNIADWAFSRCGLTNVIIPASMISIGDYAFAYCDQLTSVIIPSNVASIGENAFFGCDNLAEFVVDKNNQNYITENNVLFNKNKTILILAAKGVRGTYTIPNSVTSVGFTAFKLCVDLTEVHYNGKFADLAQIIPDGHWCFPIATTIYCTDLAVRDYHIFEDVLGDAGSYYLDTNGTIFFIGTGKMGDCISDTPYWYDYKSEIKNAVINDGITYIGDSNFSGLSSLTSVTIPGSVTRISGWAFNGCDGLKDVYYSGTREGWNAIDIGSNNDCLTNAAIHCSDGAISMEIVDNTSTELLGATTITVKGGTCRIATDLHDVDSACSLVAVVLDGAKALDTQAIALTPGQTEASTTLNAKNIKKVKLFIWDSFSAMKPLCKPKEIVIPE